MNIKTNRTIINADALGWLKENKELGAVVTSLPDMEEVGMEYKQWLAWMDVASIALCDALSPDAVIFFYQTNRRYKGHVIDKNNIISNIFIDRGYNKVIDKIVLKREPGVVSLFRPSFTYLFAFSKTLSGGKPTPDVIRAGRMVYKDAMGLNAASLCLGYIKDKTTADTIYDPFCGQGSALKIANDNGFNAIGIDIDPEQCNKAKEL